MRKTEDGNPPAGQRPASPGVGSHRAAKAGAAKPATREDRLKAALKANMARRKAQARVRAETGGPGAGAQAAKEAGETD
ncbi:hypothetical protein [Pseudogemmobacter sonorensis]|uniref:hypothetical protein n=1 Tax=Pseudogemmobacter sonorensis TaxID=2989681 RepID=UPI0036C21D39